MHSHGKILYVCHFSEHDNGYKSQESDESMERNFDNYRVDPLKVAPYSSLRQKPFAQPTSDVEAGGATMYNAPRDPYTTTNPAGEPLYGEHKIDFPDANQRNSDLPPLSTEAEEKERRKREKKEKKEKKKKKKKSKRDRKEDEEEGSDEKQTQFQNPAYVVESETGDSALENTDTKRLIKGDMNIPVQTPEGASESDQKHESETEDWGTNTQVTEL